MAATEYYPEPQHVGTQYGQINTNECKDHQQHRRRPFSAWVKKLAHFKSSDGERTKRETKKKRGYKPNNPYPESGHVSRDHGQQPSTGSFFSTPTRSHVSAEHSTHSLNESEALETSAGDALRGGASMDIRSIAQSHGASSLAGTARTTGGGIDSRRGGDSTFSSPAPSVGSLATTLTTIQSMAPNGQGGSNTHSSSTQANNTQSIQFSQPFPTNQPASAIPAHLAPASGPATYTTATANNLLTDNASILTLASSSKRRRRRSMDTDASVRAMAPSSLWGGSRESLPLSLLSSNVEGSGVPITPSVHGNGPRLGAERNSIYSTSGVAPTIASERNSIYAKQGDGASVRSGLLGHGKNDSIGGSVALSAPREIPESVDTDEQPDAENKPAMRRETKER